MKVREALAQCGLVPVDAQVLLAHVVARDRSWIAAHRDDALPKAEADAFFALAKRRRDGAPVAYLTGVKEFWGLPLRVTPAVLVPRPETETLVELALESIARDAHARVLDLATGSGAVALAIAHERPQASVVATDIARDALDVARGNAARLALANVTFVESDWWTVVDGRFDAIVSNPPYVASDDPHLAGDIRFEPRAALVPPGDALSALRTIVTRAPAFLAPGGRLAVEHGHDQSEAVQALMRAAGFEAISVRRDLAGIARVVGGRRP
ncbi:MAG: peptide chain release factor N(5)-glutamine methyltransferase [Burkholderiales bacterium]